MKSFSPLADRTAQAHNLDNIQRSAPLKDVLTSVIPPSYASTMDSVQRIAGMVGAPSGTATSRSLHSPSGRFSHNPYGAVVLRDFLYSRDGPQSATTILPGSLDVSRESTASTTSSSATTAASSVSLSNSLIVKAPIRRVYRNGRPVPVFAGESSE